MAGLLNELQRVLRKVGEVSDADKERFRQAAKKMVDNIEDDRDAGKYSDAEREKMEQDFFDNMVKLTDGGDI